MKYFTSQRVNALGKVLVMYAAKQIQTPNTTYVTLCLLGAIANARSNPRALLAIVPKPKKN